MTSPTPLYIPLPTLSDPLILPPRPTQRPPMREWVVKRFLSTTNTNTASETTTGSSEATPLPTRLR